MTNLQHYEDWGHKRVYMMEVYENLLVINI